MSEYLRHDFALYSGTLAATGTVVPRTTQLDRDGFQAINCSHFNSVTLQLTGTWSATVQIQFSMDGTNWDATPVIQATGGFTTSITANGSYSCAVLGKYVRIQCTAYTSGTITGSLGISAAYVPFNNTQIVNVSPSSGIGASLFSHLISAATTNATSVKTSNATVNNITVSNNGAGVAYFKLYNKASAPTVGTDTPVMTLLVPVNGSVTIDGGYIGMRFSTGLAFAITGGMPVADTTAVGLAQVSVSINYT